MQLKVDKWLSAIILFCLLGATPVLRAQVLINEVDADQVGTDGAEFVELFGPANTPLDGMVLVFFNGSGDTSYAAFDLDGRQLNAQGFFVVCGNAANLANCDMDVSPDENLIQNGADAVALYNADGADFPNGTAVTDTGLIDALVYDTDDADDTGLLSVLTPGNPQIDENGNDNGTLASNSRLPDGGDPRVTTTYTQRNPTPGLSNTGMSMPSEVVINEFVANHTGTDTHEFIEVFGLPDTDYSHLFLIQLEGDAEEGPGVVDTFYQVGMTDESGFWATGFLINELANGSKTLLLVENFTGMAGADLDSDDNGTLDSTPWDEIRDSVAVNEQDLGDRTYAETTLLAMFDGMAFTPGGASRIPNGLDTNAIGDWKRNAFNGVGLPGFFGELLPGEAVNTPLAVNSTVAPPPPPAARINEFVANHAGTDTHEFIEIFGDAGTDYGALSLLLVDGDAAANPGQISAVLTPGTTDIGGFWRTEYMSEMIPDGTLTLMLVTEFSGMLSDDLDTDDDGTLDAQPWTLLLDSLAVAAGGSGDRSYSGTVLGAGFDGDAAVPGGASRLPNGVDSDAEEDWQRNDFDGEGLPGFSGTLVAGEALNTPGTYNAEQTTGGNDALINELVADHTGNDDHEFVEILGQPDTNYSNLWIVQLAGDLEENPGRIVSLFQVGVTDAGGYWTTGFRVNELGNGSKTLLLVEDFSGALDVDLDAGNDGSLESEPWTTLVDGVAIGDGGAGDATYAGFVLLPGFDGGIFTVGGASRLPNGVDTDAIGDWVRNDFSGAGLPGFNGGLDPGEALNTPNLENSDMLPPGGDARLSEFVADHAGADTHEFVEIFGEPMLPYTTTFVLVLDGNSSGNPGQITQVFQCGVTDADGFWASDFQAGVIDDGSITLFVVEGFSGAQDDDLDADDNGVLDVEPWTILRDSVAVDDGDPGDIAYSSAVLGAFLRSGAGHPGGASRYPFDLDTDTAADWLPNDFDGAGLPGFAGSLDQGEANNTPGRVNTVGLADYYAGVNASSAAALRTSLHERIDDHLKFPYTSPFTDTWDILEKADEDPLDVSNVLALYKNAPYAKEGGGNDFYNREHTWPKSFGFPDDEPSAYPYTDSHHLMLADAVYNSQRNNIAFGTCNGGCSEAPTLLHNGQGGGSGVYPGNGNWYTGSGGTGTFEVWIGRRGDVARALLYLDVRYEGGFHGRTGYPEPDLQLTDNTGLINTFGTNTGGTAYMGRLSTLLAWHVQDPVDDQERERNEVVYGFQGNRNPFVDHPEWVDCLFNGNCGAVLPACVLNLIAQWTAASGPCSPELLSVRDYIQLVNGTCICD